MTITDTNTGTEKDIDQQLDDQNSEQPDDAAEQRDEPDEGGDDEPDENAETFPRSYVEKLRRENQRYRDQAATADTLGQRLHVALIAATGRLADPTDLEFDAAHLDETDGTDALTAAIDDLLTRKPHLASRRPVGDIGQGAARSDEVVDLAGILRSRA